MNLPRNLRRIERILYLGAGVALVVVASTGLVGGIWRIGLGLVGAVITVEGAVGY